MRFTFESLCIRKAQFANYSLGMEAESSAVGSILSRNNHLSNYPTAVKDGKVTWDMTALSEDWSGPTTSTVIDLE